MAEQRTRGPIERIARPAILAEIPHDRHAVIEASAGTGKTYTIEHLVVDLLLRDEALRVDQILVMTFTERATSELKARIRGLLSRIVNRRVASAGPDEVHWEIDHRARQRLRRALFNFDTAPIHTIHGFCHRVLIEHAFQNRRLFEQEHVDFEVLFERVFHEALRTTLSLDEAHRPYLEAWLGGQHGGVEALEHLLGRAARARGELRPRWDEAGLMAAAAELGQSAAGFGEALRAELKAAGVHHSSARAWVKHAGVVVEAAQAAVASGQAFALLEVAGDKKVVKALRQYLEDPGPVGPRSGLLFEVFEGCVPLEAAIAQQFAPVLEAMLAEEKAREGLFGYDDMLAMVWDSLDAAHGQALLEVLRGRFRYGLIDEFQDTDDLQWKIFERIFHDSAGQNIFYLIGDPKQAIYGFRGADVQTYLYAREVVLDHGGARVRLDKNYRSTGCMIDALNHLFDAEATPPFFTGRVGYPEPVGCGFEQRRALEASGQPAVPVHLCEVDDDELDRARFDRGILAGYAREIEQLLGEEGLRVLEQDAELPRRLRPRDIFVLTRSARDGLKAAEYLRERGIPYAFFKQDGLFQTREAHDIHALLLAIARPRERARRLAAWRTPFFDVSLADLGRADHLVEADPLVDDLLSWHRLAQRGYFETLFAQVIEQTGLIRRKILFERGERELTNYLHIFELLLQEANVEGLDIDSMAVRLRSFIEARVTPGSEDGNVQRLESERDAVQIMTMHKSKGLEAEVVFVWGGFGAAKARGMARYHDDGRRVLHVGRLHGRASELVEREAAEEAQRLLYVALTRAKSRLYLPYLRPDGKGRRARKVDGMYGALIGRLDNVVEALPARHAWFELRRWPVVWPRPRTSRQQQRAALSTWRPPADLPRAFDDRAFRRFRENQPQIASYSSLKGRAELGASGRDIARLKADEGPSADDLLPEGAMPGGRAAGIFLHALLEDLDFARVRAHDDVDGWMADEHVAEAIAERMGRFGVGQRWLAWCQRMLWRAATARVKTPDGPIEGLARVEHDARELEFIYPIPEASHPRLADATWRDFEIQRGYIKGFIDLLFEHRGRTYFADWKSDILADYAAATLEEHVASRYELQSILYSIACAKLLDVHDEAGFEARFGGFYYFFVRGMHPEHGGDGVYFRRPSWAQLRQWEIELQALFEQK